MLYLHCGWPRTGTSGLQAALYEQRGLIASAGFLYPVRWMGAASRAHHGLYDLLNAAITSAAALDQFKRFVAVNADLDLLFSAEGLTNWLFPQSRLEALLGFLKTAAEAMPVRCVWTLRRVDEAYSSLYLLGLKMGVKLPPLEESASSGPVRNPFEIRNLDQLFGGMKAVEECIDSGAAYVKYDPGGAHNGELLSAFGLPPKARAVVLKALESGPRRNVSPSHKQVVALLNVDALSARAGVELDRATLLDAFRDGEIEFEEDWRCDLIDGESRRALHEEALAASRKQGFSAYAPFFADDEIETSQPSLGSGVLTDEDLKRLIRYI